MGVEALCRGNGPRMVRQGAYENARSVGCAAKSRVWGPMIAMTWLAGVIHGSGFAQEYRLPPSLEAAFQPDFARRDLGTFKSQLRLNADQQAVVQSLFEDYETEFSQG